MDINQWLNNTNIAETPTLPQQLGFPTFLHDKHEVTDQPRSHRLKRKRASSDSSLLAPGFLQKPAEKDDVPAHDGNMSDHDPSSSCSSSTEDSASQPEPPPKTYERRARHKTRPELYEAKSGHKNRREGERTQKTKRKKDSKGKRHKSKRKESRSAGLVQSFHAKNVPKDRLTLTPAAGLGLFKRGRASIPVKGRGLPDLVFSEMKFLQTPKDHQDEQPESSKKTRKKDRTLEQQDDISSYFDTKRPVLAERHHNIPSKTVPPGRNGSIPSQLSTRRHPTSTSVDSPRASTELSERGFLGLGGRGNRPPSTSCISRSESVHPPPTSPPIFPRAQTIVEVGQSKGAAPRYDGHGGATRASVERLQKEVHRGPDQLRKADQEHQKISTERIAEPVVDEQHVLRAPFSAPPTRGQRLDVKNATGAELLPLAPLDADGRDTRSQSRLTPLSRSEKTRARIERPKAAPRPQSGKISAVVGCDDEKENIDPKVSSPLGKLLRRCDEALADQSVLEILEPTQSNKDRFKGPSAPSSRSIPRIRVWEPSQDDKEYTAPSLRSNRSLSRSQHSGVPGDGVLQDPMVGYRELDESDHPDDIYMDETEDHSLLGRSGDWLTGPQDRASSSSTAGPREVHCMLPLRLRTVPNTLGKRRQLQSYHIAFSNSAVTFADLASSRFYPTKTATPAETNKIQARTAQVARHFSTTNSPPPNIAMASLPISEKGYHGKAPAAYTARKIGAPNTLEHRIFIEKDGVPVSPFHDIPLYANEQQTILNMIVEVPRWTNAKMEISKEEKMNPIKQDTKKGKLRFVRNCFPHKGYLWNYGAFPQTWEDPNVQHPETKANGDNDPLDVCEIGELVATPGEVKQVKILGVMALLDEGETDWKIMVIDVNDPLAPKLNDIEDVERHLPGLLRATNEWFRIYKIPDGKPENQFAFSGECKNKKYATDVVRECAEAWEKLITGKTNRGDISLVNTTCPHSPDRVDPSKLSDIPKGENKSPAPIDPSIDKWFFISGASV
ncbi:hypothetical protein B0A49_05161 [Cryomyces minteri]|uniref:Inorganic pyrophosphatase n=2 Tax=Cryomyces minteri TaxID=331657 RepID=A0A4U0WT85_9PEZI|nr:hypothetical protein B0A49_05161 [Cryomyces minteri]